MVKVKTKFRDVEYEIEDYNYLLIESINELSRTIRGVRFK